MNKEEQSPAKTVGSKLSHISEDGAARMVDVSEKLVTVRTAIAQGVVHMLPETLNMIRAASGSKGDVLQVARLAGIMAAKRTSELIPLCHAIPISSVIVDFAFSDEQHLQMTATAKADHKTGVEMEALTAVAVAALTVYDMCKAVDRAMTIESIHLLEKSGGASGDFRRDKRN